MWSVDGGKYSMRTITKLACGLAVLGAVATALGAQEMKPDRAIKYRQGIMQAMGWHVGVLGRMAKGEIPYNKDTAVRSATFIADLSKIPWDGFVPVSYEGGAKTKAKADIWQDKAKFDKLAEAMQAEVPKLVAAAQTGELSQLKTALSPLGKACNNCHDKFENE